MAFRTLLTLMSLSRPCLLLSVPARNVPPPQNKYKTSVKKKAERQILAVKPSATEEELSAVFEQEVRLAWFVLGLLLPFFFYYFAFASCCACLSSERSGSGSGSRVSL